MLSSREISIVCGTFTDLTRSQFVRSLTYLCKERTIIGETRLEVRGKGEGSRGGGGGRRDVVARGGGRRDVL
jgi:hypothetical protein